MTAASAHRYQDLLEEHIDIDATRDQVWSLLVDLPRMSRWSPQVFRVSVRSTGPVGLGTRTRNINRKGVLVWRTRSQVVEFDPPVRLGLKVRENRAVWSFELTELPDGRTRLCQRRETPEGIHEHALKLEDRFMGGVQRFEESLRAGMRQTLHRIKKDAEA